MSQILLQKIKICQSIGCNTQLSKTQIVHNRKFCGNCKKIEARWYCLGGCGYVFNSITDSTHRIICQKCAKSRALNYQRKKMRAYQRTTKGRKMMQKWSRKSYLVRAIKKLELVAPESKRLELKREELVRIR